VDTTLAAKVASVEAMPGQKQPDDAALVDSAQAKDSPQDNTLTTKVASVEASSMETAQATESPLDAALAAEVAPAEVVSAELKHVDAAPAASPTVETNEVRDPPTDKALVAEEALEEVRPAEETSQQDATQARDVMVDTPAAAKETSVEAAPEETRPAETAVTPSSPERALEEVVPAERAPAETPQVPSAAETAPEKVVPPERTSAEVPPADALSTAAATAPEEAVTAETIAAQELPTEVLSAGVKDVDIAVVAEAAPTERKPDADISVLGDAATATAQPEEVTKAEPTSATPEAAQEPPREVSSVDTKQAGNAVFTEAETAPTECVPPSEGGVLGDAATATAQHEEVTKADPTSEPPEARGESMDSMEDSRVDCLDCSGQGQLIKTLNERCLGFLSEQLPLLKIPQIHSVEDGLEYTIDNIDLSAFKIKADGLKVVLAPDGSTCHETDPILDRDPPAPREESAVSCATNGEKESKPNVHERDAVRATAAEVGVTVPKLKWSYQQTAFPYLNGLGTACACLSGGNVTLAFQLHRADVDGEVIPQLGLSSCSVFIDSLTVVEVNESVFSWVYNRLAFMLQDQVRQYVSSSLQAALSDNVASLLAPLNTDLRPHWPTLLSAMGFTADVLPLAGDSAKPAAPKEENDAKNHTGGWPLATPPTSPTAEETAAATK